MAAAVGGWMGGTPASVEGSAAAVDASSNSLSEPGACGALHAAPPPPPASNGVADRGAADDLRPLPPSLTCAQWRIKPRCAWAVHGLPIGMMGGSARTRHGGAGQGESESGMRARARSDERGIGPAVRRVGVRVLHTVHSACRWSRGRLAQLARCIGRSSDRAVGVDGRGERPRAMQHLNDARHARTHAHNRPECEGFRAAQACRQACAGVSKCAAHHSRQHGEGEDRARLD